MISHDAGASALEPKSMTPSTSLRCRDVEPGQVTVEPSAYIRTCEADSPHGGCRVGVDDPVEDRPALRGCLGIHAPSSAPRLRRPQGQWPVKAVIESQPGPRRPGGLRQTRLPTGSHPRNPAAH